MREALSLRGSGIFTTHSGEIKSGCVLLLLTVFAYCSYTGLSIFLVNGLA